MFFLRDPSKFPRFIHTQKRDPQTHLKDNDMFWGTWCRELLSESRWDLQLRRTALTLPPCSLYTDYLSQNPEAFHQVRTPLIHLFFF